MAEDETTPPDRGLHRPPDGEVGPVIFETGEAPPPRASAVVPPAQQVADAPTDAPGIVERAGDDTPGQAPPPADVAAAEQAAANAEVTDGEASKAAAKAAKKAAGS